MDMLAPHSGIDLYDTSWPIYARTPIKLPTRHPAPTP